MELRIKNLIHFASSRIHIKFLFFLLIASILFYNSVPQENFFQNSYAINKEQFNLKKHFGFEFSQIFPYETFSSIFFGSVAFLSSAGQGNTTQNSPDTAIIITSSSTLDSIPNPEKQEPYYFKTEVISKEIMEEYVEDGIKVTKIKNTVRFIDKPTLTDLVEMNRAYFTLLETKHGLQGIEMIEEKTRYWQEKISNLPDIFTIETVKFGENSIEFEPFTRDTPSNSPSTIKDPVNFIFRNNGFQDNVNLKIRENSLGNWNFEVLAPQQFVWIDNTAHDGTAGFIGNTGNLSDGDILDRFHVRLFTGFTDTHNEFVFWTLGAVHHDEGIPHIPQPFTWEDGEQKLRADIIGQEGFDFVGVFDFENAGEYQGILYDGQGVQVVMPHPKCFVPTETDWEIFSSCTLEESAITGGNVFVKNNSILTIDNDVTLDLDLAQNFFLVESGSSLIIRTGGGIT